MFPRFDGGTIDFTVEVMRHGHVHRIHLLVRQQSPVIIGALLDGREIIPVPAVQGRGLVANRDNFRPHIRVWQVTPARRRAGKFPPHQSQPDNPKAYSFHGGSVTILRPESMTYFDRQAHWQSRPTLVKISCESGWSFKLLSLEAVSRESVPSAGPRAGLRQSVPSSDFQTTLSGAPSGPPSRPARAANWCASAKIKSPFAGQSARRPA